MPFYIGCVFFWIGYFTCLFFSRPRIGRTGAGNAKSRRAAQVFRVVTSLTMAAFRKLLFSLALVYTLVLLIHRLKGLQAFSESLEGLVSHPGYWILFGILLLAVCAGIRMNIRKVVAQLDEQGENGEWPPLEDSEEMKRIRKKLSREKRPQQMFNLYSALYISDLYRRAAMELDKSAADLTRYPFLNWILLFFSSKAAER